MKTMILVSLFISSISFANRESGGRLGNGTQAVYVAFNSIGTGIDVGSEKKMEDLVFAAKEAGLVIRQTNEQNGREGERLICVEVVNANARYNLIHGIAAEILSDTQTLGTQRTLVSVGEDCDHPEQATNQVLRGYVK